MDRHRSEWTAEAGGDGFGSNRKVSQRCGRRRSDRIGRPRLALDRQETIDVDSCGRERRVRNRRNGGDSCGEVIEWRALERLGIAGIFNHKERLNDCEDEEENERKEIIRRVDA